MSLNVSDTLRRKSSAGRLIGLWPLWLFILLLALALHWAVAYWSHILLQSAVWQKSLHQQMSHLLQMVAAEPHRAGLGLMAFSLVYGVLHAVGPGHGKVVIMTYLATHPSKLKSSLKLTCAASLVQGMVAVLLVTVVLGVLQLSSRTLHSSSFWMEKGSFILIAVLGAVLCFRALQRLSSTLHRRAKPVAILRLTPLGQHDSQLKIPVGVSAMNLGHRADICQHNGCGCGHRHLPSQEELNQDGNWRTRLTIVLAMGLRPCSGAILVLLFSKVIGVFLWGIASALVMALGTALTISTLALLVFYCRRMIERLGGKGTPSLWRRVAGSLLSLAGGLILLGSGILLYLSAQPVMMGGIRPFSG
ncbi:nickel transporter [Brenneria goodwinii]|uniref:Nickel/cobalt efflux system n=1 Tax=Brenneria goodwinii TaxID=1109412 RepID=A0A0G4JWT8_9GAMM|nr:nickel/cobalt transporter [Brenneria goodwinii]ATA22986.1 nickel transporter [Brenneria goodwinii]RLM23488.1 nickel transporter [Brenneria goodwinii]CPR17864.1 putative membrane protein [Brenneria goodwinii]